MPPVLITYHRHYLGLIVVQILELSIDTLNSTQKKSFQKTIQKNSRGCYLFVWRSGNRELSVAHGRKRSQTLSSGRLIASVNIPRSNSSYCWPDPNKQTCATHNSSSSSRETSERRRRTNDETINETIGNAMGVQSYDRLRWLGWFFQRPFKVWKRPT